MQTLPTQLKHSSYALTQVERGPQWAIYRKSKPGYHNDHFEAVIIKTAPEVTFPNGITSPEREVYPKSEDWGTLGWSVPTLEQAREILQNAISTPPVF